MANSPITGNTDLITYKILADGTELGGEYQVVSIDVEKKIGKVSTAKVVLLLEFDSGDNATFKISEEAKLAPGSPFEIRLGYHVKDKSVYKGIITHIGVRAFAGTNQFIIECSDKAVKMTLGRKSKYFKNKTDSAIISSVISDNGLSADTDATKYKFKQLIQYYASDWDFIRMRAEANGLLVYADGGKVFVKKPGVKTNADLEVTYGKDVIEIDGNVDVRHQIGAIKTHGWSMSEQKLTEGASKEPVVNAHGNLTGKKLASVLDVSDYELHSTAPLESADLKDWASGHLMKSRLARIYGDIEIVGTPLAKLNTLIEIKGFGARINGKALITKVHHSVSEGKWITTVGFGLSPEYFAERPDIHAPAASGLLPAIQGLQNGTVKKIADDPDGELRILIDVPVIDKAGDGIWARLSNFYSTKGKGAFFIPEVGDEVVIGFLNNDPRFPIILGSLYSSKIKAAQSPDKENSIKAILTKNDLKLEFNDKDKVITVETPGGNKAVFSDKDKSILLQDKNGNKIEMNSSGITIKSPKKINIKATSDVSINSNANIALKTSAGDVSLAGKNVTATAQMNFSAKGNMNSTFEAGLNATLKSGLNTTIKGLMVMIN